MPGKEMLVAIDEEIERLQTIRRLLVGEEGISAAAPTAKKGARKKQTSKASQGKRVLSPEARERIAAAQRKRWAASKRAAKKAAR